MSDTRREEKNQRSYTTESHKKEERPRIGEDKGTAQKPTAFDERLIEMESESIEFPSTGGVIASVTKTAVLAKVSDVTTSEPKQEEVKKESEVIILESKKEPEVMARTSEAPVPEPKPYVAPAPEPKPEVAPAPEPEVIKETVMERESEMMDDDSDG